jgi:subtilisin family serine protease
MVRNGPTAWRCELRRRQELGPAITGVIDSGCDIDTPAHQNPYIVGWSMTDAREPGPFEDFDGHGSHVCGTILGQRRLETATRRRARTWLGTERALSSRQDLQQRRLEQAASIIGAVLSAMHIVRSSEAPTSTPRPDGGQQQSYGIARAFPTVNRSQRRTIDGSEAWD